MDIQSFRGISNFNFFENRRTHDPRKPLEPNYPAVIPSLADFLPSGEEECFTREKKVDIVVLSEEKERAKLLHAPPGSVPP